MNKKQWLGFTLACIFSILGIGYLWNQAGQFSIFDLNLYWILFTFLLFIVMWFCDATALYFILRSNEQKISIVLLFRLTLSAFFFGAITPFQAGMLPALTGFLAKHNIPVEIGLPSILLKCTINGVIRSIISIILAIYMKDIFNGQITYILFSYGGAVFIGYALLLNQSSLANKIRDLLSQFFYWLGSLIPRWKNSMNNVGDSFQSFPKTMEPLLKKKSWILPTCFFILMFWSILFSLPYPIFRSLHLQAPFVDLAMLQAAYYMFQSFLPSPGGSGIAEVGLGYVYSMFIGGSSPVFVFLLRLFTFYLPLAIGGIFLFGKNISSSK
jgi:hypothetical protein